MDLNILNTIVHILFDVDDVSVSGRLFVCIVVKSSIIKTISHWLVAARCISSFTLSLCEFVKLLCSLLVVLRQQVSPRRC